jgi:hypothetical protein
MVKKDRLDEALEPVSGRDAVTAKKAKTARDESIASLYLTPELKSHIRRYSAEWGASQSAVVRYALGLGFEAIRKGKKPRMETVTKAVLD